MPSAPLVILTQEEADNARLDRYLAARGIATLSYPCIETVVLPYDGRALPGSRELEDFGVIAFTSKRSAAGLEPVRGRLKAAAPLVACVGDATAREVDVRLGLKCAIMPRKPTAAELAGAILERLSVATPLLYARGDKTTGELQTVLTAQGWDVSELIVYENRAPQIEPLALDGFAAAVFASPSAVERFFEANAGLKEAITCIAVGPVTGRSLRELGAARVFESPRPDLAYLADAVCDALEEGSTR